jgi:hypothetical protein
MIAFKNKYMLYLILLTAAVAAGWAVFGRTVFADVQPFAATGAAIAFFFLYEALVLQAAGRKSKAPAPRRSLGLFMALKGGKILLSLVWVAVYAAAAGVEVKRFTLAFAALYFIYLLFDTLYLMKKN